MPDKVEESVSRFYNNVGWVSDGDITEDAKRYEDLREPARAYVSKCRLRVLRHIPERGENLLDMASGPIQFQEYLEYSKNFRKRYCVDLSSAALEKARRRIGDHGVFLQGSFLALPIDENLFDCTISLHTIYHIDGDRQEEAVRKLLHVTKPGQPVIIVYSNPRAFITGLRAALRGVKRAIKRGTSGVIQKDDTSLYFHAHPLEWWDRFRDAASVTLLPWRSFDSPMQKRLIPDNALGRKMFSLLFELEDRFPAFFTKHFQYPMIILRKREN